MSDLDADLLALLGPGAASPAPLQPEAQEPADAAPGLDLAALLDPAAGQVAAEPVGTVIQGDDFPTGLDQSDLAEAVQTDAREPIVRLRQIAAHRKELEEELLDLWQRLDTAQELLKRDLWAHDQVRLAHGLVHQIDVVRWSWRWTETQAWRIAYDAGLIPGVPRPADWTPFTLIEGTRP